MTSKPEEIISKNFTNRLAIGFGQHYKSYKKDFRNHIRCISKSIFDKFFAGAIILTSFPLWLMIAIAIKLESKGPVLVKEQRINSSGKTFYRYKFRSTYTGNQKQLIKFEKSNQTNELTKVGKFLKKYNLNELPQLINVLRFEMNLGDIKTL